MSGFSFMSEDRDSDVADNARPTESGFGFISGNRSESDERDSDVARPTVSGFGFISGNRTESETSEGPGGFMASLSAEELAELKEQAEQVSNTESEQSHKGHAQGSSGFGFLGGVQEEASEDERSDDGGGGGDSGFGFMGSASRDSHEERVSNQTHHGKEEEESTPSLLDTVPPPTLLPEVVQQPAATPADHSPTQSSTQAVKLASSSTASHKVVKKKKRTSKVGAQRHAEEKEVEPPTPLSRISESGPPSPVMSVPEVKSKEEVKVEPQSPAVSTAPPTPPPVTVTPSVTPQTTDTTPHPTPSPQKVVHLSDKPPISISHSPPVKHVEKDSMSDISEDNSVSSSVSASSTSKKKKKGGFMSYFSRKKEVEVVEEKKPSESSSQPYRPNTKAAKKLVVQNPVTREESPVLSAASTPTTQLSPTRSPGNTWQKPTPTPTESTRTTLPVTSEQTVETPREEKKKGEVQESVPSPVKKVENTPPPEPQREPTPPPAGPKSILVQDDELCRKIKELSKDVISGFQTSAQDIAAYQETLLQDMSEFQKQKEKAEVKCRQLMQQIQDKEIEQNLLAEKEEFEQADILTGQLETLQQEYAANIELDKQSLLSYKEAETSLKDCRLELSKKMHETAQGLGNLIRQQIEELNNMVTANLQALSDEDGRVSVEEERITMELQHVSREETTLQEETAVIENAILAQTSDVQRDKEEMDMELMGVNCEVERLEAELAQKKQEQKMLEMNLLVAEGKIREVRRKYDRQLQRIADRSMTIRAASEECAQDKEVIEAQRSHFMSEKSKLTDMESDITTFIQAMEKERDLTLTLRETFDSVLVNAASHSVEMKAGGDDTDATMLRNKVIAEETVLEKAIAALENTRQSVSALNEEGADLKEKVPVLEVEKKGHASNKRFKEAAAVAKEIKAMVARQEEISELVAAQEGQVGPQEQAIEKARAQVAVVQAELTAAERVADLAEFEGLLTEIKSLRISIRAAEKARATNDTDNVMAVVAVELLSSELQVLVDQASEIKVKHGLDDELLPPLEDDEELASTSNDDDNEAKDKEGESNGSNASGDDNCDEQNQSSASQDEVRKPEEDVTDEQNSEESDDNDDNDGDEEDPEEAKQNKVTQAQALLESIKSLEADLEVAVDTEEYDTAATISEQVDELTEQLDKLLASLSWTRQDLEASVE